MKLKFLYNHSNAQFSVKTVTKKVVGLRTEAISSYKNAV